jgi:hypothetical protein
LKAAFSDWTISASSTAARRCRLVEVFSKLTALRGFCMFAQNMLEIAVELTAHAPHYENMALKFAEHFVWIAAAMNQMGDGGMWDEENGF